ncbi:hypothetical protein AB0F18_17460 [Streptomyces sp. NPDC029216]|uniref:hypothetical protein n=1 Tax=Streptomyces sp. NPDC029216 TaxID=3154701 RepID=UPI0033CA7D8E
MPDSRTPPERVAAVHRHGAPLTDKQLAAAPYLLEDLLKVAAQHGFGCVGQKQERLSTGSVNDSSGSSLPLSARSRDRASCLRRWGVEDDVVDAAELIASELFTIELQYGASRVIRLQLIAGYRTFTVAVAGGGPYVSVYPMVEPDDQGRRGLFLVDHLARVHRGYRGLSIDGTAWCLLASAGLRAAA